MFDFGIYRCRIPQCDGESPEFVPPWLLYAIPGTSAISFDNCAKFVNSTQQQPVPPGTCPATLFDRSRTTECESYVYENTLSVVYDVSIGVASTDKSQMPHFYSSFLFTVRFSLQRMAKITDRLNSHDRYPAGAAHYGLHIGPVGPARRAHDQRFQHRLDRTCAIIRQHLRVVSGVRSPRVYCRGRSFFIMLYFG